MAAMNRWRRVAQTGLIAAGAAVLVVFFVVTAPSDPGDGGRRTVIRIWHVWGGPMLESFQQSVAAFEDAHPDIACRLLFIPNDLANNQKFYTAVIGDCAPDVIFVDGPQVAEWAERGLLTDLSDLMRQAGRPPETLREEFFPPCWRQCVYEDKVWAVAWCADPNFCLFWNKDAIRRALEAGEVPADLASHIDPEQAPVTLEDLDLYNEALTRFEGDRLVRIGLVPWGVYGRSNSLFTWGWAFGGEFYDAARRRVTANDPHIVQALEWMADYARRYDVRRISALQSTFGSAEQNPFITGKQVLQLFHVTGLMDLRKYAPDLEYGMAPVPYPPGGEKDSSWVGGWTLAIPSTVRDPERRRAAMTYILWSCASAEGTRLETRTLAGFPGWRPSPFYVEAARDPRLAVYVDILKKCRHQRPVMPAQAFFMNELDRAVDQVTLGKRTAKEALDEATANTQAYLDKMLARRGGRP